MFEIAEVGNVVDRETYDRESKSLRAELLAAQKAAATAKFSVVVLVSGVEGAGKSEIVNLLLEWMDGRGIETHAFESPTDEERERPPLWRYWRVLPPQGRTAILFGGWYSGPLLDAAFAKIDEADLDQEIDRIVDFERMLSKERTLVVKFWLHLSKTAQKTRLKTLQDDPLQRLRVTRREWKHYKLYDEFRHVFEHAVRRTSVGAAPWTLIEAADERHRNLVVARTLLEAIRRRLAEDAATNGAPLVPDAPVPPPRNVLNQLDQQRSLSKEKYEDELLRQQGRLNRLSQRLWEKKRSAILVFEGPDAAGKGGAIRRLTHAMDARRYRVVATAAPTDEEAAHPYLWRFWRALPRAGHVAIYDRSWYGRVLVERIEGFCSAFDWQRAYGEINEFEEQLTDAGIVVLKFWLAITSDEQLQRFRDRQTTPFKQYKITEDDWRNRAKWDAYEAAACEMVERTSTEDSPWILIPANDKRYARIQVLRHVVQRLREERDAE